MAYRLNGIVSVGGPGDSQIHSDCAIGAISVAQKALNDAMVGSPIIIDAYPKREATTKFLTELDNDPMMAVYFGHGSSLQMAEHFFSNAEISRLRNPGLPFMFFFGCDISQTDRLVRGVGEQMILGTDRGLVGGLISIRKTHDNVNRDIFSYYMRAMTTDLSLPDTPARLRPLSIGEANSLWKNHFRKVECGRYLLVADPSLVMPLPTLGIDADITISQTRQGYVAVSGTVLDTDGAPMENFNGEAVVRILEPAVTTTSKNYQSGDNTKLTYTSQDATALMKAAEVKDGRFSLELPLTDGTAHLDSLAFAISAYDHAQRIGAGVKSIFTAEEKTEPDFSADTTPPAIDALEYERDRNMIYVEVSDNEGIALSQSPMSNALVLTLDGKRIAAAGHTTPFDAGHNGYKKRIGLPVLSDGHHIVKAIATDIAGNSAEAELAFITGPVIGTLDIELSDTSLIDEIDISVTNASGDSDLFLYIEDAAGQIVDILPIGIEHTWDGTSSTGEALPTGVYRLHVKSTDGAFSPAVHLPVIR